MRDVTIYMPTRGRVDKQITLLALPTLVRRSVIVVCHPGEEKALGKIWGGKVRDIISIKANHIGEVRQKCIDQSDNDYIIFVDDSLDFHIRAESDTGSFTEYPLKKIMQKHFTKEHVKQYRTDIFRWILEQLKTDKYGMVGISRRSSNTSTDADVRYNDRICSFWGINRKLLRSLNGGPKFSDMQLKEDFYIALNFLVNGIQNITSYKYAYGRVGGANTKGGCSIYRNLKNSNDSALKLKAFFPRFVKIREKSTKSWRGEFGDKAYDVMIYWQKAYKHGIRKEYRLL